MGHAAHNVDPRHIEALLTDTHGENGLDDLTPEQAAFCIAMAKDCVQVFGRTRWRRWRRNAGSKRQAPGPGHNRGLISPPADTFRNPLEVSLCPYCISSGRPT